MRTALLVPLVLAPAAAGCVSRASCPPGQLEPPERTPAFVVVRSDYASSALALLDGEGLVIDDDWVDSGTRVSSLVTGVSADVVVPSTAIGGVAWIDRYAVDVLTIATLDGDVTQIDLLGITGSRDGYTANPHDALRLDDGRLLVTRHDPNPSPDASELSRGNDVVVIEDDRIVRAVPLLADEGDVLARPDVLLPLVAGDLQAVLVTLTRLDRRFTRAAPGAALLLDEELTPSPPLTFGALENCGQASVDPDDPARAYVLCAGLATGTEDERRPHAGIVELTLSEGGSLTMTGTVSPGPMDPVPSNGIVALGGRRVLAVAYGRLLPRAQDRLLEVDVGAGTSREILRSTAGAFVLGDGTFDAAEDVALVPDAETSSILRIEASTATLRDRIELEGCVGLPPREIGPLRL